MVVILCYEDVPSLATGKVVLGFVITIVAVIVESSETTSAAAINAREMKEEIRNDDR